MTLPSQAISLHVYHQQLRGLFIHLTHFINRMTRTCYSAYSEAIENVFRVCIA